MIIGGASLVILASLVVYLQILATYTTYGLDYLCSYLIEEEAQYFAVNYAKEPQTPLPQSAFFSAFIGEDALPENIRRLLQSPPSRKVGTVQIYDDTTTTAPFSLYLQARPLIDGKILYLFETLGNDVQKDAHPLTEKFLQEKMLMLLMIGLSVPVTALLLTTGLVWFIVKQLHRLARWSTTLTQPNASADGFPNFSCRELNSLASSLANSVRRVKADSLREERLLRYTSHELRTPLAIVKANLQLLEVREELSPPLRRIQRSVQNMQSITETLLWMSIEHAATPVREPLDMRRVLEDLMEEHRYLFGPGCRQLLINVQDGVYLLPAQACRIIFGNLLRNAVQYADEGQIDITCTPQQLSVINRIVSLAPPADSADYGYGLGLDLVQQLCERLGFKLLISAKAQYFEAVIVFAAG